MTTLQWRSIGPDRPEVLNLPPASNSDNCMLTYDQKSERLIYMCEVDNGFGQSYAFDGQHWELINEEGIDMNEGIHGGYDTLRQGIVCWYFKYSYQKDFEKVPKAFILRDNGLVELSWDGECPSYIDEDDDSPGIMAFDERRKVWVCFTRDGIWELDENDSWHRKADSDIEEWSETNYGGLYDPVGKYCFFWMDDGGLCFFSWDGTSLKEIAADGLSETNFFDEGPVLCAHPEYGVLLSSGSNGLYTLSPEGGWSSIASSGTIPPLMENGCMAYDPVRKVLVVGPGIYDGRKMQQIFYYYRDGVWECQGNKKEKSPVRGCHLLWWQGQWWATGNGLKTWRWEEGPGWQLFVDQKPLDDAGHGMERFMTTDSGLVGVGREGAVYLFNGKAWSQQRRDQKDFKERYNFVLCNDADRLVVWGGDCNMRETNDTLIYEGKDWRKPKKKSPKPDDFKHGDKDGIYVGYTSVYDTALSCAVRFGYEEIAWLKEDVWQLEKPKNYTKLVNEEDTGHWAVHDAITKETLLINMESRKVIRFDLKGCIEIADFDFPEALLDDQSTPPYRRMLSSYDSVTRTWWIQDENDINGIYCLDLSQAFEAAQSMGPRTLVNGASAPESQTESKDAVKKAVDLFFIDDRSSKFWSCQINGTTLTRHWGRIGTKGDQKVETLATSQKAEQQIEKMTNDKRKNGYIDVSEFKEAQLIQTVCCESRKLILGEESPDSNDINRLGGYPSGISAKDWPQSDGEPMGFLFQIETGNLLKKHAGIAVFCTTDGSATEAEDYNKVVLLKTLDANKRVDSDVPPLALRPIKICDPLPEIDEERAETLTGMHPVLDEAIDTWSDSGSLQQPNLTSKLGGQPDWIQNAEEFDGSYRFIAQLDLGGFDANEWGDPLIDGTIYIFVDDDEKKTLAFWQYT